MADQMEMINVMPLFTLAEIENLMYGDLSKYSWFRFCKIWPAIKSGKYIALIYLEKKKTFYLTQFRLVFIKFLC